MYYQLLPNSTKRTITVDDSDGGTDVLTGSNNVLSALNNCTPVSSGNSCLTVSVEEIINLGKVTMFPNPTSDLVNIEIENFTDKSGSIILFNTIGETVLSKEIDNLQQSILKTQLDVGSLPNGLYYTAIEEERLYHIGKIIKL